MKKLYLINFCLDNESDFEDYHPKFDSEKNELLLSLSELIDLIDRCVKSDDNVGISYPSDTKGKWDALEIHGDTGDRYILEYQIGYCGGSYIKKGIEKPEVVQLIQNLSSELPSFEEEGFEFVGW